MLYELRLTVDAKVPEWLDFCGRRHVKPLLIELQGMLRGTVKHPLQAMFAATHDGDDSTAQSWAQQLETACAIDGFQILRRKLEIPLDKSGGYEPLYYECHVKALLRGDDAPGHVVRAHHLGWAASRNLLRPTDDGLEKWYFTHRARGIPYLGAAADFQAGFVALGWAAGDFVALKMESEAVIEDSDEHFDAGWCQ